MARGVEEVKLQLPSVRLAARLHGPVQGVPVLALHGWLDNALSFERLAPLLPGCRIAALDLPGHGLSGWRPRGLPYHFTDYVPDVLAAANALEWQRFILLGHSLGAAVASFAAAVAPERVASLVLIEGLGPRAGVPAEEPARLHQSITQMESLARRPRTLHPDMESAVKARRLAGGLAAETARLLAVRGTEEGPDGVRWRHDPRVEFGSPFYYTEEQVRAYLGRIVVPTLLLVADQGWVVGSADLEGRAALVRGLNRQTVPGGHYVHLEEPRACAQVIESYL